MHQTSSLRIVSASESECLKGFIQIRALLEKEVQHYDMIYDKARSQSGGKCKRAGCSNPKPSQSRNWCDACVAAGGNSNLPAPTQGAKSAKGATASSGAASASASTMGKATSGGAPSADSGTGDGMEWNDVMSKKSKKRKAKRGRAGESSSDSSGSRTAPLPRGTASSLSRFNQRQTWRQQQCDLQSALASVMELASASPDYPDTTLEREAWSRRAARGLESGASPEHVLAALLSKHYCTTSFAGCVNPHCKAKRHVESFSTMMSESREHYERVNAKPRVTGEFKFANIVSLGLSFSVAAQLAQVRANRAAAAASASAAAPPRSDSSYLAAATKGKDVRQAQSTSATTGTPPPPVANVPAAAASAAPPPGMSPSLNVPAVPSFAAPASPSSDNKLDRLLEMLSAQNKAHDERLAKMEQALAEVVARAASPNRGGGAHDSSEPAPPPAARAL